MSIMLPCPFCGGAGEIVQVDEYYPAQVVECESCGARGPWDDDKEGAVKHWNRRV